MKPLTLFTSITLAATALAQNVFVNLPDGSDLIAGDEITVQVTRPNSLTGSTEIGIAIGIQPCGTGHCYDATSVLGTKLYTGSFTPAYHESTGLPYENFTVTIPETAQSGPAVVGVAHAALVGAANWPFFEVVNTTATIV
ncbi:hypothetical protein BJY04DRAFT_184897 [Aspergillus karnatakaensis]|uniref:uncharacterized protein n=1 Tax=Aspergillus karnatakaensis TaxID=1810916 RepID=UPI003CCD9BD2